MATHGKVHVTCSEPHLASPRRNGYTSAFSIEFPCLNITYSFVLLKAILIYLLILCNYQHDTFVHGLHIDHLHFGTHLFHTSYLSAAAFFQISFIVLIVLFYFCIYF